MPALDRNTAATTFKRRDWLRLVGGALGFGVLPTVQGQLQAADGARVPRVLFTSRGKTGIATLDENPPRYLELDVPNQATWQPAGVFGDGRRLLLLSMEPRRDGPGRPFDEYYTQTPTHIWSYDVETGELVELATRERLAPFQTPALLLGTERMLVQVVRDRVGQIFSMNLDGSDPRPFTQAGEGLPYGLSLRGDGRRVAYHLASPEGYQIWTADVDGGDRVRVAADAAHLYFGTAWSPDGNWVLYVDCHYQHDPGHDWADVCVSRPDGSEQRVLTRGQAMWFAATYGSERTKGGGSNVPSWMADGAILFPRRSPGACVAWQYQADRADVDHFNRAFRPEHARGGAQLCRLEVDGGATRELTPQRDGTWDFRGSVSPDGRWIAFCRAATGEPPAVWVIAADGSSGRLITRGIDEQGADHPRWL